MRRKALAEGGWGQAGLERRALPGPGQALLFAHYTYFSPHTHGWEG